MQETVAAGARPGWRGSADQPTGSVSGPMAASTRSRRPDRALAVVVCLPGLEAVVAAELDAMGIAHRPAGIGALAARVTDRQLYRANVGLASATRVLVDAGSITARSFAALEERVAELDLSPWLAAGRPVRFRVSAHRSRLSHTGAIEERLRRVLRLGPPSEADDPDALLVVARVERDALSLRIDSSGSPLHHRGWRGPAGKAPLRETIAAAALAAAGWRPGQTLVDPFCGSGTIAIEAARRAAGVAPGADRRFAFEAWPSFAPGTWASVRAEVDAGRAAAPAADAPIVARDRDAGAVAAARENAERAGVADRVVVEQGPISTAAAPAAADGPGWIVTNPPWGARLAGGGDLRDLYARFGQVATKAFGGWGVAVLAGDTKVAGASGLATSTRLRTRSGARFVTLLVADLGLPSEARGMTGDSRATPVVGAPTGGEA